MKKSVCSGLLLGVFAISGCSGSSSSGSTVNLNGTWKINPHSLSKSISFDSFRVTFSHTDNTVKATSAQSSAPAGTISCSSGIVTLTGTVAGNRFNGQLNTNASTTTFSVSGTSSAMAGTFNTHIHSGPCKRAGIITGNLTMAKI
jgi:hypothetical protein